MNKQIKAPMTAAQLRTEMVQLGFTQAELSRFLQIDPRSVRRWMTGERPVPGFVASILLVVDTNGEARQMAHKVAAWNDDMPRQVEMMKKLKKI